MSVSRSVSEIFSIN